MMSLLIFNQKYYGKFFIDPSAPTSKMNWVGESSFLFAIIGTGLYTIMGLCSLPSIGSQMTNKQWQLIYGPIAWLALLFGTVHVLIMGVKGWDDQEKWPGGMPPITMTSVLLPFVALFLKLVLIVSVFLLKYTSDSSSKRDYQSIDNTIKTTDLNKDIQTSELIQESPTSSIDGNSNDLEGQEPMKRIKFSSGPDDLKVMQSPSFNSLP